MPPEQNHTDALGTNADFACFGQVMLLMTGAKYSSVVSGKQTI